MGAAVSPLLEVNYPFGIAKHIKHLNVSNNRSVMQRPWPFLRSCILMEYWTGRIDISAPEIAAQPSLCLATFSWCSGKSEEYDFYEHLKNHVLISSREVDWVSLSLMGRDVSLWKEMERKKRVRKCWLHLGSRNMTDNKYNVLHSS